MDTIRHKKSRVLYKEEQRFMRPKLWFIIIPVWTVVLVFFGKSLYEQLNGLKPAGEEQTSDTAMILTFVFTVIIMAGTLLLMNISKLITEIKEDGIYFRYPPFIRKFKKIGKETIKEYEVRQYRAHREYGGYGLRTRGLRTRKWGIAYNVKGNLGLQLHLIDDNKILIGTQRKEAIMSAMIKMIKKEKDPGYL